MKPAVTGIFVLAILASVTTLFAADEGRGKVVYQAHCAVCHGIQGKGDGSTSGALMPKPRDYTNPEVKASLTKESVTAAIRNGVPKTQMEGWEKRLAPEDIQAVMEYILSLR